MKIAVACEGTQVTGHFGHCQNFMLYDTKDGKIESVLSLPNPGHRPGFLPNYLHEQGAEVVISGGMGGGAIDIFNSLGIEAVTGATGDAQEAVVGYLGGTLVSTGSVCHQHAHKDSCGE